MRVTFVAFPGFLLKHHRMLLFLGVIHTSNQRFSQPHPDLLTSFRNFKLASLRNDVRPQNPNYQMSHLAWS